ncbi:MAG TPA: malectin domain-containing carbohydrate-binding protein [Bdellovibrionota bacterium]|nr:malectin domain-containing carbohydrate-binding protein [Bdellovibrionota bacterium]
MSRFAELEWDVNPSTVFGIVAGGSAFTDSSGLAYRADAHFGGSGATASTTATISGTTDDYLYQHERYGFHFNYNFPVANGNYNITLKFAENYWIAAGRRVFDVAVNGTNVINNLDIYSKVGANAAYDVVVPVTVTGGAIQIDFDYVTDKAKVSAIRIDPAPIGIVANGSAYTDSFGVAYVADSYFTGGNTATDASAISGALDDYLYQHERYGNFYYDVPVANGTYNLTLKFAETYWTSSGQRVFDIAVNGTTVVNNLDIFAKVGADTAYDLVLPVTVTNGAIKVEFDTDVDNAKVGALLIEPVSAGSLPAVTSPVYFVDPAGSNTTGTGAAGYPWATLSYACSQVSTAGATIVVRAGNYTDNSQCVLASGVNIHGDGKSVVTITSNYAGWYIYAVSADGTDANQYIGGFTLNGNARALDHGVYVRGRSHFSIIDADFISIADKAIQLEGAAEWTGYDTDTAPPSYGVGNVIRNVTIQGCSAAHDGGILNAALWATAQQDLMIDRVVVDEGPGTGGQGNAFRAHPGWLKGMIVKNSKFKVNSNAEPNPIKLRNIEKDTEIYNSEFWGGFVSFVSGRQNGGTWALKFHDNTVDFSSGGSLGDGHELSMDYLDFYNNHVTGYPLTVWNRIQYDGYGINNVRIHHNVIENAARRGIMIQPGYPVTLGQDTVQIWNNVISNITSATAGVYVNGGAANLTNLKIQNNIIQNTNGAPSVRLVGGTTIVSPYVTYNDFYNTAAVSSDVTGATISNNSTANPTFQGTGYWKNWFKLQSSSSLIDAGINVGFTVPDGAPDMGAFEY